MATDPYQPAALDDVPRQAQNVAPGVHLPAPGSWRADRPGDLPSGQPRGALLGDPGPNVGYALLLAHRAEHRLALAPGEDVHDALAVVADLAMARAASYHRAPVATDVECAMVALGYQGGVDPDFAEWRTGAIAEAAHEYPRRRALVDAVPLEELRLPPAALVAQGPQVRATLRAGAIPA